MAPWKKQDSPAVLQTVAMRALSSNHLQCHGWIKENEENWPEQIANEQEEKPLRLLPGRCVNWISHCWRMTLSFRKTHRRLLLVHSFPRDFWELLQRPEGGHRKCVALKKIKFPHFLSGSHTELHPDIFSPGRGVPDVDVPLWQGLQSQIHDSRAVLKEIILNVH